jgi:hypothetical protein
MGGHFKPAQDPKFTHAPPAQSRRPNLRRAPYRTYLSQNASIGDLSEHFCPQLFFSLFLPFFLLSPGRHSFIFSSFHPLYFHLFFCECLISCITSERLTPRLASGAGTFIFLNARSFCSNAAPGSLWRYIYYALARGGSMLTNIN